MNLNQFKAKGRAPNVLESRSVRLRRKSSPSARKNLLSQTGASQTDPDPHHALFLQRRNSSKWVTK